MPPFHHVKRLVHFLEFEENKFVRDHIVLFLEALLLAPRNAKAFIDDSGIDLLVDMMALVHWQKESEVTAPLQSSMLLTGGGSVQPTAEWYLMDPCCKLLT